MNSFTPSDESVNHLSLIRNKNIIYCVLDWGLGHATRSIPLIRKLMENNRVLLASSGNALIFLRNYFPHLEFTNKPSLQIHYPEVLPVSFGILRSIPVILKTIREETRWIRSEVEKQKTDLIFSDNCYGCFHSKVPSVLITHQLMLKMPSGFRFAEKFFQKRLQKLMAPFTECWIPDYSDIEKNLSGDLSHKYPVKKNYYFIGPISRFENRLIPEEEKLYQTCYIISGPEPHRSRFFKECLNEALASEKSCVIISGQPGNFEMQTQGKTEIYPHLPDNKFLEILTRSEDIVSRSGYSSIMDLHTLKLKARLIPTPGQTEQEYLATIN